VTVNLAAATLALVNGWGHRLTKETGWGRRLKRTWRSRMASRAAGPAS